MMIEVMKSKLHCVKVTEANLNYMGSITIDEDLMDAANLIAGEKVQIVDNNNGEPFETYVIKGERIFDSVITGNHSTRNRRSCLHRNPDQNLAAVGSMPYPELQLHRR